MKKLKMFYNKATKEKMISTGLWMGTILSPVGINLFTHLFCDYFGCNEWYSLVGHNLVCNSCIDLKKTLKDHQLAIYCSLGTYFLSNIDLVVKKTMKDVK